MGILDDGSIHREYIHSVFDLRKAIVSDQTYLQRDEFSPILSRIRVNRVILNEYYSRPANGSASNVRRDHTRFYLLHIESPIMTLLLAQHIGYEYMYTGSRCTTAEETTMIAYASQTL